MNSYKGHEIAIDKIGSTYQGTIRQNGGYINASGGHKTEADALAGAKAMIDQWETWDIDDYGLTNDQDFGGNPHTLRAQPRRLVEDLAYEFMQFLKVTVICS